MISVLGTRLGLLGQVFNRLSKKVWSWPWPIDLRTRVNTLESLVVEGRTAPVTGFHAHEAERIPVCNKFGELLYCDSDLPTH